MLINMVGHRILRMHRRGQDEREFVLSDDIARAIALASFRPGIGEALETKGSFVVVRRLLRVADVELDVVRALKWQEILFGLMFSLQPLGHTSLLFRFSNGRTHIDPPGNFAGYALA